MRSNRSVDSDTHRQRAARRAGDRAPRARCRCVPVTSNVGHHYNHAIKHRALIASWAHGLRAPFGALLGAVHRYRAPRRRRLSAASATRSTRVNSQRAKPSLCFGGVASAKCRQRVQFRCCSVFFGWSACSAWSRCAILSVAQPYGRADRPQAAVRSPCTLELFTHAHTHRVL